MYIERCDQGEIIQNLAASGGYAARRNHSERMTAQIRFTRYTSVPTRVVHNTCYYYTRTGDGAATRATTCASAPAQLGPARETGNGWKDRCEAWLVLALTRLPSWQSCVPG
jgi:hypothetical protein